MTSPERPMKDLAERSLREWAQAAEENPVLKARVKVLEEALRNAMDYMPGQMEGCDCSSCKAREIVETALNSKAGS